MGNATSVFFDELDAFQMPQVQSVEVEQQEDWFETGVEHAKKHGTQTLQFDVGDWINEGVLLANKHKLATAQWDLGDWFLRCPLGDDIPGAPKPYEMAEGITGLSRATLYDWASTCKRVPVSVRTEKLPFSHHRAVANALPDGSDEEKKHWLDLAAEEQLTVRQLQERLKPTKAPDFTVTIKVTIPDTVHGMLRNFAKERRVTVNTVASEFLIDHLAGDEMVAMAESAEREVKDRAKQRRRRHAMAYDNLRLLG